MSELNTDSVVEEPGKQDVQPGEGKPKNEQEDLLKSDLFKYKQRWQEAQDQLNELKTNQQRAEEERLKKSQEWQKYAEKLEQERDQALQDRESTKRAVVTDRKFTAIKQEALRLGIRQEALEDLELLPLDDLEVEYTSTGKLNVLGAKEHVERLKVTRPHWFGKKHVNVDGSVPEVQKAKAVSKADVLKASVEAKKTGDYSKYEAMLREYQKSLE